jgi:hypothetical protein
LLENKKEADRIAHDMLHVEAVIRMFDPAHDIRRIAVRRRRPNPWFKRGTVFRHALDVLRDAHGPLTAREITERMLAAKGVTDTDQRAVRDLIGAVNSAHWEAYQPSRFQPSEAWLVIKPTGPLSNSKRATNRG